MTLVDGILIIKDVILVAKESFGLPLARQRIKASSINVDEKDEINPYASPSLSSLEDTRASPLVQVQFAGDVTEQHLSRTYSVSPRSTFVVVFLIFIAIVALGRVFYSVPLPMRPIPGGLQRAPEPFGTLLIAAALIMLALGMYFAFQQCFLLAINLRVRKLIKYRPWLIGQVHGTFSAAFTTIWHKDVGFQLVSHDLFSHLSFNSYVVRAKGHPFAIVPTSCFYETDWHQVLDTLEQRQQGFLLPIPPVVGSHVCTLSSQRLSFLESRLRGFRGKGSVGGVSWLIAAVTAYSLWRNVGDTIPIGVMFVAIPVLVFVFYVFRVALFTWHTKRQFANEKRGYLSVPELASDRGVSWFNRDVLFWNTGRMWIHFPTRYVEKVRVEFSVIEFQVRGVEMQFHREGFDNHMEWLAACETAKAFPVAQGQ